MGAIGLTYSFSCNQSGCSAEFEGTLDELEEAGWFTVCMCGTSPEEDLYYCPDHVRDPVRNASPK